MKKILSLILFAILLLPLEGQGIIRANPFYTPVSSVVWSEEEYQAVYNAMTTKPSIDVATAQNAMVKSLVDGGYWVRIYYLNVYATEINTGGEALINWIDPGTNDADNVHSTAWTTLEGYTGDGANDYISTNFNPTGVVGQDDASAGLYIRNNLQDDDYVFGATDRFAAILRNTSNWLNALVNSNAEQAIGSITSSAGLWIFTRTASNVNQTYYNGAKLESAESDVSTNVPNDEFHIFKRSGQATCWTAYQASIFFVMDGVTDGEAAAINTIFEAYMDDAAIGTGVQP